MKGRERCHETLNVVFAATVEDIEIVSDMGRAVDVCGGAADRDELYASFDEDGEDAIVMNHFLRMRRPASRSSSAICAICCAFSNRSSGVSFRFSRINVRSTSFLYRSMMSSIDERSMG